MRPLFVLAAAATLLQPPFVFAQKRAITHEDVWLMKRVGEPVVSPDGKQVVFPLVEPEYEPSKQVSDLWIVPTDGSAPPRRLTSTKSAEGGVEWSPDGKRLLFTAKREGDDAAQVYVLPLGGGEAVRITSAPNGVTAAHWSPDGQRILCESSVWSTPEADRKARKYNARVYDAVPFRYWNTWLDERRPHVFVQDAREGPKTVVDLLAGTQLAQSAGFGGRFDPLGGGQSLGAIWAPDGQSIVFSASANLNEMMWAEVETHLYRIGVKGGEPVRLTPPGASYSSPQFAPDGRTLYALQERTPANGRIYSLSRLVRVSWPDAGPVKVLTDTWDRSVSSYAIAPDGRSVVIEAEDDGHDKLFRVGTNGGAVQPLFPVKEGGYTSPKLGTAAGSPLVVRYGTAAMPPEIATVDASGNRKMLTSFNAARLAELDLPPNEEFWFTAKNGKRIHNILTFPPQFDPKKKYPIVSFPHGGPNSMSKDAFSLRWNFHYLASPGYILLQTNYTGSTGFGEKFADDIERDVLRGPGQEILEAIAEAGKRYAFIDLTRQAAAGASYGGYLMNWFNGHTNQFRCLVNHAGAVNNESQYGTNDGGLGREQRMGGPIWEKGGQWNDQSPIRYAGNWQTPMLITQGELDYRVPVSESMTTFKILQRRKVPSRLVVFPEHGHWILRGEDNRFHMQEVLGWLERYLK